jgi:hypothetical protein
VQGDTQRLTRVASRFQLSFNDFLKVDFRASRVTDDGLLLIGELDE